LICSFADEGTAGENKTKARNTDGEKETMAKESKEDAVVENNIT